MHEVKFITELTKYQLLCVTEKNVWGSTALPTWFTFSGRSVVSQLKRKVFVYQYLDIVNFGSACFSVLICVWLLRSAKIKGDEVKVRLKWGRSVYAGDSWGKSVRSRRNPCKSTEFPFQIGLLNTLTHQTFGGEPVCESCECRAASADDAAPLCLTTPPSQDVKW